MISGDPLAGRDDELATIRRALSGGSKHSGVVIVGAADVGKPGSRVKSSRTQKPPVSVPTGSSAPNPRGRFRWAPSPH